MTASLFDDAMAHHIWATERLIDACSDLTPEQLAIRTAVTSFGVEPAAIDLWAYGEATQRTRPEYL